MDLNNILSISGRPGLFKLHKQWKNDLGPVAKEHRENLWTRFQNASKVIQERRQDYQKDISGAM